MAIHWTQAKYFKLVGRSAATVAFQGTFILVVLSRIQINKLPQTQAFTSLQNLVWILSKEVIIKLRVVCSDLSQSSIHRRSHSLQKHITLMLLKSWPAMNCETLIAEWDTVSLQHLDYTSYLQIQQYVCKKKKQ